MLHLIKPRSPKTEITISPSVTEEQRNRPEFIELFKESEQYFNCSCPNCFNDTRRMRLCLHEAGHVVYARAAGINTFIFHGPEMWWNVEFDAPTLSGASVSWPRSATGDLKQHLGSLVFSEFLATPDAEPAVDGDLSCARKWFDKFVGGGDAAFEAALNKSPKLSRTYNRPRSGIKHGTPRGNSRGKYSGVIDSKKFVAKRHEIGGDKMSIKAKSGARVPKRKAAAQRAANATPVTLAKPSNGARPKSKTR